MLVSTDAPLFRQRVNYRHEQCWNRTGVAIVTAAAISSAVEWTFSF